MVMWALLFKYIVMIQAGPEKAIQHSIQQDVVRFRENRLYFKKAVSQNLKKTERKGVAISCLWHWTGLKNVWLLQHDVQCHML